MKNVKDIFATSSTFSASTAFTHTCEDIYKEHHSHISLQKLANLNPIHQPNVITTDPHAIQYHLNGALHGMDTQGHIPKQVTLY